MGRTPEQPTRQYLAAKHGLSCGDSSFAEYYIRNQPRRSRSARELLDILDRLGWLMPAARSALGLAEVQLTLEGSKGNNGHRNGHPADRLGICREQLESVAKNGLNLWSLVTIIGEVEGVADPRDKNWRKPVAAELSEYVDRGLLARVGERYYLPTHAPPA